MEESFLTRETSSQMRLLSDTLYKICKQLQVSFSLSRVYSINSFASFNGLKLIKFLEIQ